MATLRNDRSFCVAGAAPDTGNLGVSALLYGTLGGLSQALPDFTPVVFDHGRGVRPATIELVSGRLEIIRCGVYHTRRLYRPEALSRIRVAMRLGSGSPPASLIAESSAILDLSGGDSFTDLYGERRFRSITLPKLIALEAGLPLFLLPQTYGPFADLGRRRLAQGILRQASHAWARDLVSYAKLQELLGDDFDADRHREGVDVAFAMESLAPPSPVSGQLSDWIDAPSVPVAGINVSGLLYNGGDQARSQFGLKSNYRDVIREVARQMMKNTDWKVVLVPHVAAKKGRKESERGAARLLAEELGQPDRVIVAPSFEDPRHVKWLISKFDWFCGTRMHSTIASLSSRVPSVALAYSDKTQGVFETCGMGRYVIDLRTKSTNEIAGEVIDMWTSREDAQKVLVDRLPDVIGRARTQADELAVAVLDASARL